MTPLSRRRVRHSRVESEYSSEGPVIRLISLASGGAVKTTGFNINDTDTNYLESFAYCGKRARPPEIASADTQVEPNSVGSTVATCPRGNRAIAGGFGTDQLVITLTSMRSGSRGWKVVGFGLATSKGQVPSATLTAYAYCKAPGAKSVTKSNEATVGQELATTKRIDRGHGWMTSALSTSDAEARITTYAYCRR